MGGNAPCKIVGIGSIQIKVHDEIVRTLTNVCHVPELKKNLIYVGAMDSKGFTCCVEGGVMQIKGKGRYGCIHGSCILTFICNQLNNPLSLTELTNPSLFFSLTEFTVICSKWRTIFLF